MLIVKKLLLLMSSREKRMGGIILILMIFVAFFETIGVASIFPFMSLLTNPDLIESNFFFNKFYETLFIFGIDNYKEFLFASGLVSFFLLIFSLLLKIISTYLQVRFVRMREYSIGKRLLEGYLNQPYSWFLNKHSADLGKNILSEIGTVVDNALNPLLELLSKSLISISILILLVIVDPFIAIIVGVLFGSVYALIFFFIKKFILNIGKQRSLNNEIRFKVVREAFDALKEIKVRSLEENYIQNFSISSIKYAGTIAFSQIIAIMPRFILEIIAFGSIILVLIYMVARGDSLSTALPIISLYIYAGYRLLPALQQIYSSMTKLNFVGHSINFLYKDTGLKISNNLSKPKKILTLNNEIVLKNIYFSYPNSSSNTINNISLRIPAKSITGLVGATGSGKTTIVDIILGLLEPQKGSLNVDGVNITRQNSRSWQQNIGYVPQQTYLSDNSVSENIAFGLKPEEINQTKVEQVSKIANLHDFVINELSNQYQTEIGEKGIRISGGQRQRIGIARALYHDPQLLILDEATSSLDNETEKVVMDAINNLKNHISIILIAHRLETVKKCDVIFLIENGRIKDKGKFHKLIDHRGYFKKK